jgi:hypothetical protein
MSKHFKVGNQVFGARKDLAGKKGIITAKTNAANGRAEFVVRWEGSAEGVTQSFSSRALSATPAAATPGRRKARAAQAPTPSHDEVAVVTGAPVEEGDLYEADPTIMAFDK